MSNPSEKHFNALTPAEDERLAILLEEMGEAIQAIGKIQRHGYESCSPVDPQATTNRELLEHELGDVTFAIKQLVGEGDISQTQIANWAEAKAERIGRYLHHQELPEASR